MKITRDVVTDLLPLYVAGEASADTRALVEEYLLEDPGLQAEANHARRELAAGPPTASAPSSIAAAAINSPAARNPLGRISVRRAST